MLLLLLSSFVIIFSVNLNYIKLIMFRSEDVVCYHAYFSKEQSEKILSEFGYLGSVEIEDLRIHEMDSQKPYSKQLLELNEDFRQLSVIKEFVRE